MSTSEPQIERTDAELAMEMLKRKLVNESQLKAAIDYQESVGGRLVDILLKLGLVQQQPMDDFLRALESGEDAESSASEELVIDVENLIVHRKLVEKVPSDVVAANELLLFFPPKGTRAILMSAKKDADERLPSTLAKRLGVDIHPVELDDTVRARYLDGAAKVKPKRAAEPQAPADDEQKPAGYEGRRRPHPEGEKPVLEATGSLEALVELLVKKQLITHDELAVEIELVKRRGS